MGYDSLRTLFPLFERLLPQSVNTSPTFTLMCAHRLGPRICLQPIYSLQQHFSFHPFSVEGTRSRQLYFDVIGWTEQEGDLCLDKRRTCVWNLPLRPHSGGSVFVVSLFLSTQEH